MIAAVVIVFLLALSMFLFSAALGIVKARVARGLSRREAWTTGSVIPKHRQQTPDESDDDEGGTVVPFRGRR